MTKEFTLQPRTLPLDDSWDVIVVGGGPAGCTAAAAAAREGAKTLLIEATGALGGMGTQGLIPAWCPFTDKERIIYSGMAERVLRETMAGMPHVAPDWLDWTPIDPERLKRVYDDLVTEAGVTVLFNTFLTSVDATEDASTDVEVRTLVVSNKSGLTAYRAKVYVDGTGDADLAVWAGAAYEKGDPETGELQPATHCFTISNVDMYGYLYRGSIRFGDGVHIIDTILASGRYPEIPDTHGNNNIIGPGTIGFNSGHLWNVDNTDPLSVSRAMMQGRKIADAFQRGLAESFPEAFGNAFLSQTATLMGIRETRRIVGDYVLTLDDYLERRSFPDEICRNAYYIDVHNTVAEIEKINDPEWMATHTFHYGKGESHGIPYRCLTPKCIKNVLVAGRSISTDRKVQGSTRVMPVCLAMGEAAGTAAGFAATMLDPDVHAVDVDRLRARLREEGAYLPDVGV